MLTATGLQVEKLPDILEDVLEELRQKIDPSISVNDSDPLYQFLVIVLHQVDLLWQLGQAAVDSQNLDKAEGKFLDDIGALVGGISRNEALPTSGRQFFRGQIGTQLNPGLVLENTQTKDRYVLSESLLLSQSGVHEAVFTFSTVADNATYTITVDGIQYSVNSGAGATAGTIITAITDLMFADLDKDFNYSVSANRLTLIATDLLGFNFSSSGNISITSVVNSATVESEEEGPFVANANSITKIVTPVSGLLSTYNPAQLSTGRNRELDEDYRLRIAASRIISGKATVPAIEANLRNVPGVSYASVIENDTMEIDLDGRPPKSIEAVVEGGTDEAVGTVLWNTKAAGIETYGNVTLFIVDNDGQSQSVSFSRPLPTYIAVRITYTKYLEENFPEDTGEDSIRDAVVEYVNSLGLGKDIFPGRFNKSIYDAVEGVGTVIVEIQELDEADSIPEELDWTTAPIPVGAAEFAQIIPNSVYFVEA